jgi:hypothetical protein
MKYKPGDRVWFLAKHLSAPQQAALKEHDHALNIDGFRVHATVKSQYGGSSRSCRVTVDGDVGDGTIGTRSLSAASRNGAEARIVRDRVDIDYAEGDEEYQSGDTDVEQACELDTSWWAGNSSVWCTPLSSPRCMHCTATISMRWMS